MEQLQETQTLKNDSTVKLEEQWEMKYQEKVVHKWLNEYGGDTQSTIGQAANTIFAMDGVILNLRGEVEGKQALLDELYKEINELHEALLLTEEDAHA